MDYQLVLESLMKMSKILININELSEIEKYRKIGISNFLFAVKDYSIGYEAFDLKDIPDDVYVYLNRVMDTDAIDSLKERIDEFKRFKGIIFEDVGVFNIFKSTGIPLIWNQVHFAVNYNSINFHLKNGCASAVISSEITETEIDEIINNSIKPLILPVLAKNNIMYSRRTLLTNFNKYNDLDEKKEAILNEKITNNKFLAKETEYGTFIFNDEYFNYTRLMPKYEDKVLFFLVLNLDLSVEEINDIINGKKFGNDGFLNKKTVFKLEDYK